MSPVYRWPDEFTPFDGGRMRVRPDYAPLFEELGWTTASAVLATDRARVFRRVEERENGRLELPSADGAGAIKAFLKRHRTRRPWPWLGALLTGRTWSPPGIAEANAVGRCQAAGVPTMAVIAAGARPGRFPWEVDSFFLSEEIPGGRPADLFWKERMGAPEDGKAAAGDRKRVLEALAHTARHFHMANLFHRDFYWCHFFVRQRAEGDVVTHLIDLQRASPSWLFRWRWLLKDLAQFQFSAPTGLLTDADRKYWFQCYQGKDQLSFLDRLWYRAIEIRAGYYHRKERRS